MITAVVRFRLPEGTTRDDAKAMFEKSAPNYRGVPGLVRKYYLYGDDRTGGGVYLWNSREAAERFYDLARAELPDKVIRSAVGTRFVFGI